MRLKEHETSVVEGAAHSGWWWVCSCGKVGNTLHDSVQTYEAAKKHTARSGGGKDE